ncbi:unnamed protein product [Leptosia nina]|uniref:Uncharacterized protein n=1 Tax=Leptosia nina TaxID=320188 RepID=A0AAV1K229_9NEOP
MKYLPTGGHKETYTLITARRRYMKKLMRQHVAAPWSSTTTSSGARAQHELFELLERVQCSRLDDQRAVLPAYFTQIKERIDVLGWQAERETLSVRPFYF